MVAAAWARSPSGEAAGALYVTRLREPGRLLCFLLDLSQGKADTDHSGNRHHMAGDQTILPTHGDPGPYLRQPLPLPPLLSHKLSREYQGSLIG